MSSMIIPMMGGSGGASGGGSYIIVSGVTVADIGGKTVVVSLAGEELYNATVPSNIQSVSFTITEAGVYTITVGGTAYSVNVTTLTANYMLTVGDTSTSRPPSVFKTAGTHSYTVPSGVKKLYITGAGGGGGGNYYAGGGGGDACFNKIITVTPGQTYTITVGSGGNGTTSQTGNGSSGGASKFGSLLTLAGGGGAQYADSTPATDSTVTKYVGTAGGWGGGGYHAMNYDYADTVAYGNGLRAASVRTATTYTNYISSTGYTGSSFQQSQMGSGVRGGLCGPNAFYNRTSSSSSSFMGGCGSLGLGAISVYQTYASDRRVASWGGGGGAYARSANGSWSTQTGTTTALLKGAIGCMIISEEPLSWAEVWDLLGEKYMPYPTGGDGTGCLIV